jgi:hypothetical protein
MAEPSEPDPTPGIRAVFLCSFVVADLGGGVALIAGGYASVAIDNLPAVLGGLLGVGVAGMAIGGAFGLAVRLLMEREKRNASWRGPVLLAAVVAGTLGFLMMQAIMGLLQVE